MIRIDCSTLLSPWITPPECGGQIVEVSYSSCDLGAVRRWHDRSDGETHYELADWDDVHGEFEPQNVEPSADDWERCELYGGAQ